jgi:catechol 2,3-dioxygenase-like lactoylglutathione lyase family enzyme
MRPKLSLVTLGVRDLKRSLSFYRDGLGWPTTATDDDDVAFFPLGGIILGLYGRDAMAEDAMVSAAGEGFAGITLSHNAKSEEEVDEVLASVEKLGAKIVKKAQKVFWGGYSGYFADPDGHLWEVAHNPFWSFDEQDNIIL